jgi:hypothetical protein
MTVGGLLTFESDYPLTIKELPSEGSGMKKFNIIDEWDSHSSGGCNNYGNYHTNPAFALVLPDDADL